MYMNNTTKEEPTEMKNKPDHPKETREVLHILISPELKRAISDRAHDERTDMTHLVSKAMWMYLNFKETDE